MFHDVMRRLECVASNEHVTMDECQGKERTPQRPQKSKYDQDDAVGLDAPVT